MVKLTLKEKRHEVGDVYTWVWQSEQPVQWVAGQYMRYKLPHPNADDRGENRFFSISSAPYEQVIQITTRFDPEKSSTFKKALSALERGAEIEATGPMGDFVMDDPSKPHVFIAGGIGITPFRSMILELSHEGVLGPLTLLYSNRTEEAAFRAELDKLEFRNSNLEIIYVIEPTRIDAEIIKSKVADWQNQIYFVSGPEPMVEAMDEMLAEMGITEDKIKNDFFPNYNWP